MAKSLSTCGSLLFLIIQLFFYQTSALTHGFAPRWILDRFCRGKNQQVKVPWDCGGYLQCTSTRARTSGTWLECPGGTTYDEDIEKCVSSPTLCLDGPDIADRYCPGDPTLKFPDPNNCARYYDCSQTKFLEKYNFSKYVYECKYPQLFDPERGNCNYDQPVPINCENKPKARCDYVTEEGCRQPSKPSPKSDVCLGKANGLHANPESSPFSPDYISCLREKLQGSYECPNETIFDPLVRQCSTNSTAAKSIQDYCRQNPESVFLDSQNCARYYNCSADETLRDLLPHQRECAYGELYEPSVQSCVEFDKITTPCGRRFEPIDPCEYKIGHCMGRRYCLLCDSKCKGKSDGFHPYPTYPNSRYYLLCKGQRYQIVKACQKTEIYYHPKGKCLLKAEAEKLIAAETTTTTEAPTTTTTTQEETTTEPTTTESQTEPPAEPRTTPAAENSGVCMCLDKINPLERSLKNLTSFVDRRALPLRVQSPYDCNGPPPLPNSNVTISYEFDRAVAMYKCEDGYSVCNGQLMSTCNSNNDWDESTIGECVRDTWRNTNKAMPECEAKTGSALMFRGRAVRDRFTFSLMNGNKRTPVFYVGVYSRYGALTAVIKSEYFNPIWSPVSLGGELTFTVVIKPTDFEVSVNGHRVFNIPNNGPASNKPGVILTDGFQTEEIKFYYHGIPKAKYNTFGMSGDAGDLKFNLARNKETTASSFHDVATPNRVTDGFSYMLWGGHSCWSASTTDHNPWWMVDLGKVFSISHVVITSVDCEGRPTCGLTLMNFKIEVLEDVLSPRKTCTVVKDAIKPKSIVKIDCDSDVDGRFLFIGANGDYRGQMTLCEVEVYGGLVQEKGWTPFSCPNPPVVDGASVHLAYTHDEAIAMYDCDGSGVMCSGNDVIHCSNETGWDAKPGVCIPTSLDAGIGGSLPYFRVCPLSLGAGFEIWATPMEDIGYLEFKNEIGISSRVDLDLKQKSKSLAIYHLWGDIQSELRYPPMKPFVKGKESHIVVSALTKHVLLTVDGKPVHKFPTARINVNRIVFVGSSPGFRIRKSRIYPDIIPAAIKEPVEENLALNTDVDSSTSYHNPQSYGVDGNPSQSWPTGSCWNADVGDPYQWYRVDLGSYFYIRDIKLDFRNSTTGVSENLALNKETFGSPNYDSLSSQDNVVDGNHDAMSCYTSSISAEDPWWMVDLGEQYTISSVAIQTNFRDQYHSDLSVIIYDLNPRLDADAEPTTCVEVLGPWKSFDRKPCRTPTKGQFVMIKRIEGVERGPISICEVQVFKELEKNLHDFSVYAYDRSIGYAVVRRCIKHRGELPKDKATTLTCAKGTWGRYLRIVADNIHDKHDQMTVCELEIFGDRVIEKEWSPRNCPSPPVNGNAYVNTAYTQDEAIAKYTCLEGYATCNGQDSITCTGEEGWTEDPQPCLPKAFSAYDPSGLEIVHFCPLRLGESLEIYFIPESTDAILVLASDTKVLFEMVWEIQSRRDVHITTPDDKQTHMFVQDLPFEVNKESKIVITILSHSLHITVDGVSFYTVVQSAYLIDTAWTKNAAMGKLSILAAGDIHTELLPSEDNLAASRPVTASSSINNTDAGRAVDGDMSMSWNSRSCWSSGMHDTDPWWTVDLGKLYYVSQVTITTREDCGGDCNRRTHDFKIEVFYNNPSPEDSGELCVKFDGVLPHASTTTLNCTKNVFGRILRIIAPDRRNEVDLFTLCEVQVYGGMVIETVDVSRNLALFQPSTASSESNSVALAGRAVDGNRHTRYLSNSCWVASNGDLNPWWQVELDDLYYVSHVDITSRVGCDPLCEDTLHDFVVEVSPKHPSLGLQSEVCLQYDGVYPPSTTMTLRCTKKALGRFVRISSPGRTRPSDALSLCEVGVHGNDVAFEEPSSTNIAAKQPVWASTRLSPPNWANDDNKDMDLGGNSCWTTEDSDDNPWWMVELDDYYLVSEVELTSRSDCMKLSCNEQLRNFKIETFYNRPEPGDKGDLCIEHPDVFPHSTTKRLQCKEKTLGRFVRFSKMNSPESLTVCEFKVFGAKLMRTGWTPSKCPEPPLIPNSYVSVGYNAHHAVATYTCNGNHSMCTGSNVMYCTSEVGWEGTPGTCVQTTLEVYHGHEADLKQFPICYPRLGEGIEMWVTPEDNKCVLELFTDYRNSVAMRLTITPTNIDEPISITQVNSGVQGDVVKPKVHLFTIKKESRIVILFLTGGLWIEVDGQKLYYYPHTMTSAKINYVRSSDGLHIRMARPIGQDGERTVRIQNSKNLALKKQVSAPSSYVNVKPSNVVDGDLSQEALKAKCWHAKVGEKDQWIMIDLGKYYFIRELIIYSRGIDSCTVCDERTRDFVINVLRTEDDEESKATCAVYKGVMPLGVVETIRCTEDVWGRYVKIQDAKDLRGDHDLMTFCEIQIYGDEVVQKPWTLSVCSEAPTLADASVQLSNSPGKAVATYTCNKDHAMCTGSNVLECTGDAGWKGTLGICQKTTMELPYGRNNDLKEFSICSPKLGEGLELWILPLNNGAKVSLMLGEGGDTALALLMTSERGGRRVLSIRTEVNGINGNEVMVNKDLLTLEREAHVTVVFLTKNLLVLVDGKLLARYSHYLETPKISYIKSSPDVNIRKLRALPSYLDGVVRTPLDGNLALNKVTTAGSQFRSYDHSNVVDGDLSRDDASQCWHSDVGDKNQWVMIDLGDYYFIRELVLYGLDTACSDCVNRTHDFAIDVLPNDVVDDLTTRCAFYEGVMPIRSVENIRCEEDVWGRYVRISNTKTDDDEDLMTFCEIQVYGDTVIDKLDRNGALR